MAALVCFAFGCGADSTTRKEGALEEPCFPDDTCEEDLECVEEICEEPSWVGRKCYSGIDEAVQEAIVASPALECPTRMCLRFPKDGDKVPPDGADYADMCTAECTGDDDCSEAAESNCISGFTCAVAMQLGPFCCRKMCICNDFITVPEGGFPRPDACDPENASNTCINL